MKRSGLHSARVSSIFIMICAVALLPSGCSVDSVDTGRPPASSGGELVSATGCKSEAYGLLDLPADRDCILWDYDGEGTLRVTHINAGLNCCPGTIQADIDVDGNAITIAEREGDDSEPCRCLCLYDLFYEFTGIAAEECTISFVEQYLGEGAEPLTVTVDLSLEPQGSHCVQRDDYPWGLEYTGTDPVGMVSSRGVCKEFRVNTEFLPPNQDPALTCVYGSYTYDGSGGTLVLAHTNAGFNCCVDAIDAEFFFGTGIIEITEREIPEGGYCDCICLYDVTFTLFNIDPGEYTIRIVEPYLPPDRDPLQFTVELTETGSFARCFTRDFYPWNAGASEDEDRLILDRLFAAIVEYIGTPYCADCEECRVIGYGAKPCGGPWGYLIYSTATLDTAVLQGLVSAHRSFESYMNAKYGYSSTCDVPPIPAVTCFGGMCRAVQ